MMASDRDFAYLNPRPHLVIDSTGGGSLGNCYSASLWRVTSTKRLSTDALKALNKAGVLGFGQEFYVRSQADGKETAAGEDEVPCVTVDRRTGKPTGEPAINPYNGKPYGSTKCPFYVYECESRCDSGD
jgi:hypothetical protein